MNERKQTIVRRTTNAATRLIGEFADMPVDHAVVEAELLSILFRDKELFLAHEERLITDAEFVNAVAANLISLALKSRSQPPPRDQIGSESAMDDLRRALIPWDATDRTTTEPLVMPFPEERIMKLIEYGGGIKVTLTGDYPIIYVSGFFPCGATPQTKARAKGQGLAPELLAGFAEGQANDMVAGHCANCATCKAARDAPKPPSGSSGGSTP